ncbi:hypothetical protein FAGAP_11556 [Fusarium agapanthi]|uniref:DUF7908 domain-containing protein n=1 Tax=Fusarium agapanthi TaxID=1803897 RepID=A0A9P5B022_9HYPO|nr:hypothetical protein FAGAP_11556 [Fusarium agapanthi]
MVKSGVISLLGSLALPVAAFHDLEQMPESCCHKLACREFIVWYRLFYESGYLRHFESPSSLSFAPGVTSSLVTTEVATAPPSSTTSPSTLDEQIVFRVVPDTTNNNRLRRRALGGFIGSPSEICNNSNVFNLVDGQLLGGNVPIYFNGEDYKVFSGQQGPVPNGAITRTFFRDGDILRFQSSRIIPNGETGFCQTPSDGQVYITFSSQPTGCIAAQLSAIGVQECVNGDVTRSAAATSEGQQFTSAPSLEPIVSILSSSDELPPGVSTRPAESKPPISSSAQELTLTTDDFTASEIGITIEEVGTTAEATTSAFEETTTENLIFETTIDITTEESITIPTTHETTETSTTTEALTTEVLTTETTTQQTSGITSEETTTEITSEEPTTETTSEEITAETAIEESTTESTTQETTTDTTTEESTTENPTTTTFTSVADSTTETTTEAATTTTEAASEDIVCPASPAQCIRTFQIQCDTIIGGIPMSPSSSTLDECAQA